MNHELGYWRSSPQTQPRDKKGRFLKVHQTAERKLVLVTAQLLRARLGLPFDPRLAVR